MKTIITLITILTLIGCSKEPVNETINESCECTKLYYTDEGIVSNSIQVISITCENVGEYPHDIQYEEGDNFTIHCN